MSIFKNIINVVEKLDLRMERIRPTRTIFPYLHHAQCRIAPDDGIEYIGRGMALTESAAFEKAMGEALERYCHIHSRMFSTTNGIALHTDNGLAREGALRELLERDAYLCHFYTQTPFYRFESHEVEGSIFYDTRDILQQNGFDLKISRLSSPGGIVIAAAQCAGSSATKYGFSVGLSCKQSSILAINSAIMETLSHIPAIIEGEVPRMISKAEFMTLPKVQVHDVAALAANPDYRSQLDNLFSNESQFESSDFQPKVTFLAVHLPPVLREVELFVVKAASSDCQELFFSSDISGSLNYSRLEDFKKRPFKKDCLTESIHFFA